MIADLSSEEVVTEVEESVAKSEDVEAEQDGGEDGRVQGEKLMHWMIAENVEALTRGNQLTCPVCLNSFYSLIVHNFNSYNKNQKGFGHTKTNKNQKKASVTQNK